MRCLNHTPQQPREGSSVAVTGGTEGDADVRDERAVRSSDVHWAMCAVHENSNIERGGWNSATPAGVYGWGHMAERNHKSHQTTVPVWARAQDQEREGKNNHIWFFRMLGATWNSPLPTRSLNMVLEVGPPLPR
jgi:hypothetical protein